jgi:tetratricopeptide (TPR) repeat protein
VAPVAVASDAATEQLLSKARSLEGRGRLDLAARVWEQTLLADPNNAEALIGLAKFAKQSGKIEEANRYLEKLRSLDPKNPAIGAVEGMTTAGKQRSATEEASRLAAQQNFEGAMRIYRSLFGNTPPPGDIAIGYYETEAATPGGWKDAVAGLEGLANKYPQSEDYRFSLGRLKTYREASRLDGMQMLAAVKGDPILVTHARAAWRQALVWSAGSAASMPSLQAYLSRYTDPELQKLTIHAPAKEEGTQASAAADTAEASLGYRSLNAQKLDDAEKHFQAALKDTPHNSAPLSGMGYVRLKQEDFHAAVGFFELALEAEPKNKSVADALATARFWEQMKAGGESAEQNHPDIAAAHFEKALALRPASEQATESLAAAHMARQQPSLAVPLYEKLTRLKPQSLGYWVGLVKATYQSGNAEDALTDLKHAPPQVREDWAKNPEDLALLSFIYADAGDADESKRTFERALATARSNKTELPVYQQLEFAGRSLRSGSSKQAAEIFLQVAAKHPSNADAWTGAINAFLQVPDPPRAYEVLQRIPQKTYAIALTETGFLRSLARLQTSMKRYDLAETSLDEATKIDNAQGKQPDLDGRLQLADLAATMQRTSEAEKLLRALTEGYPTDKRTWNSLIVFLHEQKADTAALAEILKIPEAVSLDLQNDPCFVVLEAGVYSAAGRKEQALALVRTSQKRLETLGHGMPFNLDIQLAWLLMDKPDSQPEVSKILEREKLRSDLTGSQRFDLNQIWSVWYQRRAQAAIEAKDDPKAVSILQEAALALPGDPHIQATLASTFLRTENFGKAFDVYQHWDLKGATADDFRGAVGTASAVHQQAAAAKWLERGLQEYPNNSRLLQLAGEQAAQHRDYDRASNYLRQALAKLSTEENSPSNTKPDSGQPSRSQQSRQTDLPVASFLPSNAASDGSSDDLLLSPRSVQPEPVAKPLFDMLPPTAAGHWKISPTSMNGASGAEPVRATAPADASVVDSTQVDSPAGVSNPLLFNRAFAEGNDAATESAVPDFAQPAQPASPNPQTSEQAALRDEIQTELEAIEGRNTPYFQNGVNLQERSGEGGFDRLLIEEVHLEASTTLANRVRLTLIATPTYVDSGSPASPSSDGHLGFGTTSVDAAPGLRSAFGIGVEVQLATTDFGLRLGLMPQEFLVHSWIGGLRWNPASGPFTIVVDRDPVRDTKLSFAGERDPSSQLVWGGVMANAASVTGNWNHVNTGYYAKIGYQDIEGDNVAKNSRIDANVGSYFKVYRNKFGELTVGLNLTGMHYDKNLRYFTLGQGGYFSPQQYFLFNVPVHWTGNFNKRLQYSVSASLGVQHFTEDASPYFPTDNTRQALSGLAYPSYTDTGGSYNLSFHSIYQITPQWLGGFFFDVNNSREYRSVTAGLYLKYLIKPRSASTAVNLTAVPDWTGASPFNVP